MKTRSTFSLLLSSVVGLALAGSALGAEDATSPAADWNQYRGPERTGISSETGWNRSFGSEGPPVLWRVPAGSGYSGLSVVDGRIFTLLGRGGDELVAAWDAASGEELWTVRIDSERSDQFGDGPRSTPTIVDGTLYAVGARGQFVALRPETGEKLWGQDLVALLGARVPTWGISAAPHVVGDLVLLDVGSEQAQVAAFDRKTGAVRWKAGSGIPGYSAPIVFELGETRQAVFFAGRELLSLDPRDGTIHWAHPWRTSYDVNAATPILLPPNRLFVSSGYDTGAAVLEIAPDGKSVDEVWASRRMKNQFSSSVVSDGHVFGFDNKALKALDLATGEQAWQKSGFGHGSLLLADGHLIVLGEKGQLAVVEANPDRYVERAAAKPLSGKHWTVPTLWNGRLYVRNESELVCFDLSTD